MVAFSASPVYSRAHVLSTQIALFSSLNGSLVHRCRKGCIFLRPVRGEESISLSRKFSSATVTRLTLFYLMRRKVYMVLSVEGVIQGCMGFVMLTAASFVKDFSGNGSQSAMQ